MIESKTDKGRLKHILSDGLSFFKNLPHRKMPAFLLRQFGLFQSISSQLADSLIASVAWAMPTKNKNIFFQVALLFCMAIRGHSPRYHL